MHRCGWFGGVAAYFIGSLLVSVWCTVRNETQIRSLMMVIAPKHAGAVLM
jgi:hypothetical protein